MKSPIPPAFKFFWLLLASWLAGCQAPVVHVNVLKAPEFDEANQYKVFSVRPFAGSNGAQLARDIDAALAGNRVAGQALVRTIAFDAVGTAARGGKTGAGGADAIVSGEVNESTWSDQAKNREEQECAVHGDKKKLLGLIKECKQYRTVMRYCTQRTARYAVTLRVVDARDQRTVWGKNLAHAVDDTACQHESSKTLKPGSELLGTAYSMVMNDIRTALIATEQSVAVKLMDKADGLSDAGQTTFKGAVAFAKEGRMDRACDLFGQLFEKHKQSVALTYSMGLCQEAHGRLFEATELYKTADALTQAPNALISEALSRVSLHVKDANKVRGATAQTAAPSAAKPSSIQDEALSAGQKAQIQGEHRVALVIGNARYRSIPALRNSVNDALDMEGALKSKGFEVIRVTDGSREQMTQAVRSFELKLKENSTALIFYAGHGVQARGVNYLIPVDARIQSSADLSTEAIDMDLAIMRRLEDRNPRLSIIILDACRNNPFPASARSAGEQAGLASINAPRGSMVAFSTAPNKTAQDGTGRNGLYTKHLLKELQVPNRKIEDVFKRVRENVMKESANEQTPWENSAMTGDFYFSASR